MKDLKNIDLKEFDLDKCVKEYKEEIKRPNILLCGGSGVGKSSLVNAFFEGNLAKVGTEGKPVREGKPRLYSPADGKLNIYDSDGYEIGDGNDQGYFDYITGFIKKSRNNNLEDHIHQIWYCINNRFTNYDIRLVKELIKLLSEDKETDVPLMIVINKVDLLTKEQLTEIKNDIKIDFPAISVFTFSDKITEENNPEGYKKYVQKEEIIDWAIEHLEPALRGAIVPALKSSIAEKRKRILKTYIPAYTVAASGAVVAAAATHVPVADAVILMPIQTKMCMDIMKSYNIDSTLKDVAKGVISAGLMSYLGKTVASQIIGLIPAVGGASKAAINAGVAATFTATLGSAITVVCEQYLKACIKNNGKDVFPDISEFFTSDAIKNAMKQVKENNEYKQIIDASVVEAKTKKDK